MYGHSRSSRHTHLKAQVVVDNPVLVAVVDRFDHLVHQPSDLPDGIASTTQPQCENEAIGAEK
jgi:hypothetical protein